MHMCVLLPGGCSRWFSEEVQSLGMHMMHCLISFACQLTAMGMTQASHTFCLRSGINAAVRGYAHDSLVVVAVGCCVPSPQLILSC